MAVALDLLCTSAEASQSALHARQVTRCHFSHGKGLHMSMSGQALLGFSTHEGGHTLSLR